MCTVITLGSFLVITLLVYGAESIGHRGKKSERTCLNLGPISNGRVIVYKTRVKKRPPGVSVSHSSQFPVGTQLRYSCEAGYKILGINKLFCEKTGFWNTDPPICVEECGRPMVVNRNINRNHPEHGEWPWTVYIFVTRNGATPMPICTGVLVDKRTVLTAAHCIASAYNAVFTLYFGKLHRRDKDGDKVQKRMATRIIPHPDFNLTTFANDIAIVRFQPDIHYTKRIQPICLPTVKSTEESLVPGNKGVLTGWGKSRENRLADRLMVASVPVQPDDKCAGALVELGELSPFLKSVFCAGYENGDTKSDACLIRSGSPLAFYHNKTDRYTVQGLVSFGIRGQCGLPKKYTYFTKVLEYMPWIVDIIM